MTTQNKCKACGKQAEDECDYCNEHEEEYREYIYN